MPELAVFSRNYREHLEKAVNQDGFFNLQSDRPFSRVRQLLKEQDEVSVYFAVVDEGSQIKYKTRILHVIFREEIDKYGEQAIIDRLIEPSEGIWPETKTIYTVSDCRELDVPLDMTDLLKASDAKPISPDYNYSYAIVLDPKVETKLKQGLPNGEGR